MANDGKTTAEMAAFARAAGALDDDAGNPDHLARYVQVGPSGSDGLRRFGLPLRRSLIDFGAIAVAVTVPD
jgi:hypothetical protein